jgi:hypothetical protein
MHVRTGFTLPIKVNLEIYLMIHFKWLKDLISTYLNRKYRMSFFFKSPYWFFQITGLFTSCPAIPFISLFSLPTLNPRSLPTPNREKYLVEGIMCHSVSHSLPFCPQPFAYKYSLQLVWYKAFGFSYSKNTGSSLRLLLDILLLP